MNALNLAQAAYSPSSAPIRNARTTEHDTFLRVTNQLRQADAKLDHPGFVKALHDNRQLWTLLAVDVLDPKNGLDDGLRAQIVYLAEFTRLHTSKVLSGDDSHEVLIEVNSSVMSGLRAKAGVS